jgi:glutamate 5-kinase
LRYTYTKLNNSSSKIIKLTSTITLISKFKLKILLDKKAKQSIFSMKKDFNKTNVHGFEGSYTNINVVITRVAHYKMILRSETRFYASLFSLQFSLKL